MFAQLPIYALRFRLAVVLGVAALVIAGGYAAATIEVEAYPDVSDTQVVVISQ